MRLVRWRPWAGCRFSGGGALAPAQTALPQRRAGLRAGAGTVNLYPGTREYVWTLYVPCTTERVWSHADLVPRCTAGAGTTSTPD